MAITETSIDLQVVDAKDSTLTLEELLSLSSNNSCAIFLTPHGVIMGGKVIANVANLEGFIPTSEASVNPTANSIVKRDGNGDVKVHGIVDDTGIMYALPYSSEEVKGNADAILQMEITDLNTIRNNAKTAAEAIPDLEGDIEQLQGVTADIATIRSNAAKVTTKVDRAEVEEMIADVEARNKGYFISPSSLIASYPTGTVGDRAYVGVTAPFAIYEWNGSAWVDTGQTGGSDEVDLSGTYPQMTVGVAQKIEVSNNGQLAAVEIVNDADGLRLIAGGATTIDDIAYEGLTYREIFEKNNILGISPNFSNGEITPLSIRAGAPYLTTEGAEVGYALNVSGTSSQQTTANIKFVPSYIASRVNCTRRKSGYVGLGREGTAGLIGRTTNGFETISYINTFEASGAVIYCGSISSANLDALVGSPVVIPQSIFSTPPSLSEFNAMYEEYVKLCNNFTIEILKKNEAINVTYEEVYALPDASANKVCIVPYPNSGMVWSDRFCWRWASNNELATVCKAYATGKVGGGGIVLAGKNEDVVYDTYSITKLVAALVATQHITDYTQTITVEAEDNPDPYYLCIQEGDVVTWNDVLNSLIIQSDNGCGYIISRRIGYIINPSASTDNEARQSFMQAMRSLADDLGMTNTTIGAVAHALMRSTTADLIKLLSYIQQNNEKIKEIWGKLTYTIVAGGANARTWEITSTTTAADREIIPEFIGGKTGSGSTIGGYAWVWRSEQDGELYASALLDSTVAHNARFTDARQVINEAYGLTNKE